MTENAFLETLEWKSDFLVHYLMQKIIHKQLLGPLKGGISILRKILVIFFSISKSIVKWSFSYFLNLTSNMATRQKGYFYSACMGTS